MTAPISPAPVLCSYIVFCNDNANNPYRDLATGYTDIMTVFGVDLNNQTALPPAEVQLLVLAAEGAMPLLLLHDSPIRVYLQLSMYCCHIGLPTTAWDNRMFVTKGNLHNNHAITANWLPEYFH